VCWSFEINIAKARAQVKKIEKQFFFAYFTISRIVLCRKSLSRSVYEFPDKTRREILWGCFDTASPYQIVVFLDAL